MSYGVFVAINGQTYMPFWHALKRCAESSAENWRQQVPGAKVWIDAPDHQMQGRRQMVTHGVLQTQTENYQMLPKEPGHYWARWRIKSPGTAEEDDPPGGQWEVVQVFVNCVDPDDAEYLMVAVPGVERSQSIENFHWGEAVHRPYPPDEGEALLLRMAKA